MATWISIAVIAWVAVSVVISLAVGGMIRLADLRQPRAARTEVRELRRPAASTAGLRRAS